MTVYIYFDAYKYPSCICSYNPFHLYYGDANKRTSNYITMQTIKPVTAPEQQFPELFV